jgi:hypothetical protein
MIKFSQIEDCNNPAFKYHLIHELDDLGSIRCFAGVAKGFGHVIRTHKGRFRPASCSAGFLDANQTRPFCAAFNGKAVLSRSSNSLSSIFIILPFRMLFQNQYSYIRLKKDGQSRIRPVFRRTRKLLRHTPLGTIERKGPVSCSGASLENGPFLSLAPLVEGNGLLSRLSVFNFQGTAS